MFAQSSTRFFFLVAMILVCSACASFAMAAGVSTQTAEMAKTPAPTAQADDSGKIRAKALRYWKKRGHHYRIAYQKRLVLRRAKAAHRVEEPEFLSPSPSLTVGGF